MREALEEGIFLPTEHITMTGSISIEFENNKSVFVLLNPPPYEESQCFTPGASFFQSISLSVEKSEKKKIKMTHVMNCRPSVIICIYSSSYQRFLNT